MKKVFKGLGLSLCAMLLLAGCNKDDGDKSVKADISNGSDSVLSELKDSTKKVDLQALYDGLKAKYGNEYAANKLIEIIADIELSDDTWQDRYEARLEEKLNKLVEDSAYKVNGEFDEELLVQTLRSQLYFIGCSNGYGPTYKAPIEKDDPENVVVDKYLKCDYTDYKEKALKLETLKELLNEKYIYDEVFKEKETLLTTKKTRLVEYIAIDTSKDYSFDFITEAVTYLKDGMTLEEIAGKWEDKLIEELKKEYKKIGTKDDSTGTVMQDFTNGYKYDKEEGLRLKMQSIYGEDYYNKTVVTSDNKSILNTTLVDIILSSNVIPEDAASDAKKTIKINGSYYLVSPLAGSNIDEEDVRITDKTNNKYYIIKVDKVVYDKEETDATKLDLVYDAVKVLASNASLVSDSLNYYLEKHKDSISVHDEEIYTYLKTQYSDIFVD